jgi:NADPH-dependent glutamate synthase beta subunit-like oxidoreductase
MDHPGTGRFKEPLKLIESCRPLPNVTGRLCPQELKCQGACTIRGRPIEIARNARAGITKMKVNGGAKAEAGWRR